MAKRHFEAVSHRPGGCGFALVSSSLTGRVWDGCVWVFSGYDDFLSCPNLELAATKTTTGISDVLWLTNQNDLLLSCDSGELEVWTCSPPGHTLSLTTSIGCHDDMALTLSKLGEGPTVVSGGGDGRVCVGDVEAIKLVSSYRAHCDSVLSVSGQSSSPSCFISTGQDGKVRQWDLRLARPARELSGCRSAVYTSSTWEQHSLALGSETGGVDVYDVRGDPLLYATYSSHTRAVQRLTFAPWNPSLLASVSDDRSVAVRAISDSECALVKQGHEDFVRGASWESGDQTLLTCGWDGQLLKHSLDQLGDQLTAREPMDMFADSVDT